MLDNVSEAFYLGVFTDFDLDNGTSIIGAIIGSKHDPINCPKTLNITQGDGGIDNSNSGDISYFANEKKQDKNGFDNQASVVATIIYTDNTPTFIGNFIITQTQNGSVSVTCSGGPIIAEDRLLSNNALGAAPIESFQVLSINQRVNAPTSIPCLTKGTMILTSAGEKPVELLAVGDMIATKDNGMQILRWVTSTSMPATGDCAPIMIQKGAMGNARNLRVSPQHRMLVQGWKAELLFGEREVLVAAKHLVNNDTIYVSESDEITYYHILLDSHQIIFANGSSSESFHPDKRGLEALSWEKREEVLSLFPELREDLGAYGPVARTSLKQYEAAVLADNPDFLAC